MLGLGTWYMAEDARRRDDELRALRLGLALGMIMAYSPIEQGRLLDHPALLAAADRHDATPAQVALAWVLRHDGVLTVPKAGTPEHVRENCRALDLRLTEQDLGELDAAFPPPAGAHPLEML